MTRALALAVVRLALPLLGGVALELLTLTEAGAITYGREDCTDNATNFECDHPNTVSLSGFRPPQDGEAADLVSFLRCSGSLLSRDDDTLVILTAGHCASAYLELLQSGTIVDVGVSFEALIERDVSEDPPLFSANQYILGGQPVLPVEFVHSAKFDYAVIAFDIAATGLGGLATADGTPVDLTAVDPVTLPPAEYLAARLAARDSLTLTAVGYGVGEAHNAPGGGGNAGGAKPDVDKLGVRWVAEHTSGIHLRGRDANQLFGSQNPAHGDDGTCFGDSGGPLFVEDAGAEIQVGVTSSGDAVCRATSIIARTDTVKAQTFLACARDGATLEAVLACGCTAVNAKGEC